MLDSNPDSATQWVCGLKRTVLSSRVRVLFCFSGVRMGTIISTVKKSYLRFTRDYAYKEFSTEPETDHYRIHVNN